MRRLANCSVFLQIRLAYFLVIAAVICCASVRISAQTTPTVLTNAADVLSKEITIFTDRIRLDVQTSTPGISFEPAWQRRVTMTYRGQTLEVISLGDLIASKKASGRDVDLEDIRILKSTEVNSTRED